MKKGGYMDHDESLKFKQEWESVFDGAEIAPGDEVWKNIEKTLDGREGRVVRFLPTLLVAATISIAIAAPLNLWKIVNDTMNWQDSAIVYTDDDEIKKIIEESPENIVEIDEEKLNSIKLNSKSKPSLVAHEKHELKKENILKQKTRYDNMPASQNGVVELGKNNSTVAIYKYRPPIILPTEKEVKKRQLWASATFGSGSLTGGGGKSMPNALNERVGMFSSADYLQSAASSDEKNNDSQVTESNGRIFSIGASLEKQISNKLFLQAGISYMNQQSEGRNNSVIVRNGVNIPLGAIDNVNEEIISVEEAYDYSASNHYVSLPIMIRYPLVHFSDNIALNVAMGFSADVLLSRILQSSAYQEGVYNAHEVGYNPVVIAGLGSIGAGYNLSDNYWLNMEFGIRKSLVARIKESEDQYYSSFTVGLKLNYQLQ